MATSIKPTSPAEPLDIAGVRDHIREPHQQLRGRAWMVVPVALVATTVAIVAASLRSAAAIGPGRVLSTALVVLWCACALFVASRRSGEPLALVMATGALAAALSMVGSALLGRDLSSQSVDLAAGARALGIGMLPSIGLHVVLGLPDGRLQSAPRRIIVALGYAAGIGVAAVMFSDRPDLPLGGPLVLALLAGAVGLVGFLARGQKASLIERPRFQWPAWGATVAVAIGAGAAILNALVDWPGPIMAIAVGATALIPLSLAIGASGESIVRIDRLLVHTITLAGLAGLVAGSYLLIVLGLGRSPTGDERSLLGLSMLAAAVAALLWVPDTHG